MRFSLCTLFLILFSSAAVAAPQFYGGTYATRAMMKGEAGPTNIADKNLRRHLGYDQTNVLVFFVGMEHNKEGWPNVRLRHTHLSQSANKLNLQPPFTVDVKSRLVLDFTDLLFYYTAVKNSTVNLDWGFGVRRLSVDLDMDIDLSSPFVNRKIEESPHPIQAKPIVYIGGKFKLPAEGAYILSETFGSAYKDRRMIDTRFGIGALNKANVGVELGYSYQRHKFQKEDIVEVNMRMGGPYVSLTYNY